MSHILKAVKKLFQPLKFIPEQRRSFFSSWQQARKTSEAILLCIVSKGALGFMLFNEEDLKTAAQQTHLSLLK